MREETEFIIWVLAYVEVIWVLVYVLVWLRLRFTDLQGDSHIPQIHTRTPTFGHFFHVAAATVREEIMKWKYDKLVS